MIHENDKMVDCRDCGPKSASSFYRDSTKASGYCTYCKSCEESRRKARRQNNPDREKKNSANYGKRKVDARPKWLAPRDLDAIGRVYETAERMTVKHKIKHVVDHIVPLQGLRDGEHVVCGLDVPWNLAVITDAENAAKGGKFE
jgi:hypothetical protein